MNILVACEESQRVTIEMRKKGHNAFSCDIEPCSGGHPEWHIQADVLPLLNGNCEFQTLDSKKHKMETEWDLIIAFPPCTHLAVSGAAWFEKKRADGRQKQGIEFFAHFLDIKCNRVAVENPIGIISGDYIKIWFPELAEKFGFPKKPTQIIQPWQFGDNYSKQTCLWLKGLPKLIPSVKEQPILEWKTWVDKKSGKTKRQPLWVAEAFNLKPKERAKVRSKTFPGIAKAMAEQWGNEK